jgi:hypothetical protein
VCLGHIRWKGVTDGFDKGVGKSAITIRFVTSQFYDQ